MPILPRLASLWRNLSRKAGVERGLDEELAAYLDLLAEEKMRMGMDPAAARRAARIAAGRARQLKGRGRGGPHRGGRRRAAQGAGARGQDRSLRRIPLARSAQWRPPAGQQPGIRRG